MTRGCCYLWVFLCVIGSHWWTRTLGCWRYFSTRFQLHLWAAVFPVYDEELNAQTFCTGVARWWYNQQQWTSCWSGCFNQIVAKLFRRMHVLTVAVQHETSFQAFLWVLFIHVTTSYMAPSSRTRVQLFYFINKPLRLMGFLLEGTGKWWSHIMILNYKRHWCPFVPF